MSLDIETTMAYGPNKMQKTDEKRMSASNMFSEECLYFAD